MLMETFCFRTLLDEEPWVSVAFRVNEFAIKDTTQLMQKCDKAMSQIGNPKGYGNDYHIITCAIKCNEFTSLVFFVSPVPMAMSADWCKVFSAQIAGEHYGRFEMNDEIDDIEI